MLPAKILKAVLGEMPVYSQNDKNTSLCVNQKEKTNFFDYLVMNCHEGQFHWQSRLMVFCHGRIDRLVGGWTYSEETCYLGEIS